MRPECRSYCCHSHIRPCLTSCFTCFSFFTTLVATRRRRCLLRSARVNVMPEWLLSVISGILAGGIPGFRSELCCFFHPLSWPLCVVPCCLHFASFSVAILMMTHKMSSCISFLRAGSDPTSLCFLFGFGFVVVLCVLFVCLFCLCFVLMGPLTGLCIVPLPALLRLSTCRRPCIIHNSSFCCG